MILLQAEHLQKTHGMKVIFDDISVYISNGDLSSICCIQPGQDPEQRALARAIDADQAYFIAI